MRVIASWLLAATAAMAQIQPPPEIGDAPGIQLPKRQPLPTASATGLVRRIEAKSIVLEPDDKRLITVYLDAKTKFNRSAIEPGDTVSVTATVKDGSWTAVEIQLIQSGSPNDRARAAQALPENVFEAAEAGREAESIKAPTGPRNTPLPPDDDPRPRLRRGRQNAPLPADEPQTSTNLGRPPAVTAPPPPPMLPPHVQTEAPQPSGDPFLDRAREVSAHYSDLMPNFVAQQITSRYERQPKADFQIQDQIECEVLVENGIEHYRNFKKHGRSIKKPDAEGVWTSGEFRSLQDMVFGNRAATFYNKAKETIARRDTIRYQFTVPREASTWRVVNASQVYLPAYSGTVWLDAESARLLRMELESRGIPEAFPISKVETTIDYDFITLRGQKHLLPVAAAALSCETATKICSKNEIQFRAYKAFTAESKIVFDESK